MDNTPDLHVEYVSTSSLVPYINNAKMHTSKQISQIANSISEFGFNDPVGVWVNDNGDFEIVEGHGRVLAAEELDINSIPIIRLDHLTDEQRRAYALAHNKLTMNSDFDFSILEQELAELDNMFDMSDFGFDTNAKAEGKQQIANTSEEIDVESFNDDKFQHECPRCGFRFN